MAPSVKVQAAKLHEVPRPLQQAMTKNRRRLEEAGIWEFLMWIRDVEKEVNIRKVTQFLHTYKWKTLTAMVDSEELDFLLTPFSTN